MMQLIRSQGSYTYVTFTISPVLLLMFAATVSALASYAGRVNSHFDLLAADQYAAQARRAELERCLLQFNGRSTNELLEPNYQLSATGTMTSRGFGGGTKKWSKSKAIALQQKHFLAKDGVVRINGALSYNACVSLREHVMKQAEVTASMYSAATSPSDFAIEDYYGIEPSRPFRTDLLLLMTAPSVERALQELFHAKTGKLRELYESLVTNEGILYEMASVVTSKGSHRQCFHPDVPYQSIAPLYVVFVALQDVTSAMGPTTFLRCGHTDAANASFRRKGDELDSFLKEANAFEACLKCGDLVIFDARVLHCGSANVDADRALFNFSFRNPLVTGDIGYKGSMRPDYTRQGITLGDLLSAVDGRNDDQRDDQLK